MKKLFLTVFAFISLNSMAMTCDESVVEQVKEYIVKNNQSAIVDSASVNYLGDGFFEVYMQVRDAQSPDVWPSHDYYEVVIDAECRAWSITLVESHM